ncbi:RNA polymerase sigma-70 factor [Portibacter lacus]|uniref:DNA-directed RNA polymerase sigma-70 factor n=1 Tax=Portibacter lacus TaxID=1099794 RepID=A0AA37SWM9_9BACT|nr:RNA polymerase sigma-70 factor [Portibacter lacus]GLR20106.1 DNA-directed RNA polymerase sigma-70 factor [Portibacter lacus]
MSNYTDKELVGFLNDTDDGAIEKIFKQYYSYICSAVYKIIPDPVLTEDLAQDVFYELWRKREKIQINSSLKAYLKRAAINKALNYIRSKKMKFDSDDNDTVINISVASSENSFEAMELQDIINASIDTLPEKCRIVFMMSRFEEMSYKEIAAQLEISIKTVENQISKALKILKKAVNPYLDKDLK